MIKTNTSVTFPSLLYSPSGNSVTPFRAVSHLPSFPASPNSSDPSLGEDSLHRKINNKDIYLPRNHHTSDSMFMEINGHYWVPVSIMVMHLEYFTYILLHVPISFTAAANSCNRFQPPNWACSCIPIPRIYFPLDSNKSK